MITWSNMSSSMRCWLQTKQNALRPVLPDWRCRISADIVTESRAGQRQPLKAVWRQLRRSLTVTHPKTCCNNPFAVILAPASCPVICIFVSIIIRFTLSVHQKQNLSREQKSRSDGINYPLSDLLCIRFCFQLLAAGPFTCQCSGYLLYRLSYSAFFCLDGALTVNCSIWRYLFSSS